MNHRTVVLAACLWAMGCGPKQPPAQPDSVVNPLQKIPSDASRTDSGLAWKVLRKGTGTERPTAAALVTVHYTGWLSNGEEFDSSVPRGKPAQFVLDKVIPGWTEGLQKMTVGEKSRFWIPEELAYRGMEGAPKGMLIFDVELLDVRNPPKARGPAPVTASIVAQGVRKLLLQEGKGDTLRDNTFVTAHIYAWSSRGTLLIQREEMGSPPSSSPPPSTRSFAPCSSQ